MNTLPSPTNGASLSDDSGAIPPARPRTPRLFDPSAAPVNDGAMVKLALFGRPIPELLAYASLLHTKMEGNEYFPDPLPPQDEFAAVIADAKASTLEVLNLQGSLAAAVARRDEIIDKLLLKLNHRGSYVQMRSGGNSARILSAGIDVRRDRSPVPALAPPTDLFVELNGSAGTAIITWSKVKHAKMYMIEYGPIDGPKIQRPITGLRKLILHELPLGMTYQFRVCAMGGATGQSDWGPWVTRGIA